MLEGERLTCDGRPCFTHFYCIMGIGPSILVKNSSARDVNDGQSNTLAISLVITARCNIGCAKPVHLAHTHNI